MLGPVLFLATLPQPAVVDRIAESGRCVTVGVAPDKKVAPRPQIAPGPPPVLAFRYLEDKKNHRYNNADLMLDDAGH